MRDVLKLEKENSLKTGWNFYGCKLRNGTPTQLDTAIQPLIELKPFLS